MTEEDKSIWLDTVKADSVQKLLNRLNSVGANIVQSYPMAEVQSWTIQRNEAEALLSASEPSAALAPFLVQVCHAHYGPPADEAHLLEQVTNKAIEVKRNADRWSALAAFVNGLRARSQDRIMASVTEHEAHLALAEATNELERWRDAAGI